MPAAEASGLVVPLGEAVLRQACRDLAAQPEGFVAVNVSGRQLARPEFPEVVASALADSGVRPERLCLEITETVLLDSSDAPVRSLDAVKDLGVKLALDDFGTGQSSLSHLRRLPLDILKLDRSFIEELDDLGRDIAIVSAVLDMAQEPEPHRGGRGSGDREAGRLPAGARLRAGAGLPVRPRHP